jgi:hypothetical protein
MIHGFDDTCAGAFLSTQTQGGISPGAAPMKTLDFFTNHGWGPTRVKLVGYYTDQDHPAESSCDVNIADSNSEGVYNNTIDRSQGSCDQFFQVSNAPDPYVRQNKRGTTSDPIRHLGCLFAWYIYTMYTAPSQGPSAPVVILAHSMGGLIVRDAIGEAGHTPGFPPGLLDVRQVVTVGTPHGGQRGGYLLLAQRRFAPNPVPREVWDLDPTIKGSGFMSMLFGEQFQAPRGLNNAQWALIASSVPGRSSTIGDFATCFSNLSGPSALDCALEDVHFNDPYPDGDGVVQADSALSMKADVKILYGSVTECHLGQTCVIYSVDSTVEYSHEADTYAELDPADFMLPGPPQKVYLVPEFLLNDATPVSQQVQVSACWSACNTGADGTNGIQGLLVTPPSVPHSLFMIFSYLTPPPPPPTCTSTTETDDNERASYVDNRGNDWHVYVDLKRDTSTGAACQMQVVVRIFPPAPDGTWKGKLGVMSYNGSNLVSGSSGTLSSSTSAPGHLVWRGPWFNVSPGYTYSAKAVEYNGSNSYPRARGYIGL